MIHLDESMREEALDAAYQSASDRLNGMTLEEFKEQALEFEVVPVVVDGEIAGALICKGPEIHACILERFKCRWMSKNTLRFMWSVVHKYGYATTHTTTEEGRAFVERLGFKFNGKEYVLR